MSGPGRPTGTRNDQTTEQPVTTPPHDDPFEGVADDELVTLDRLGHVTTPSLSGVIVAPLLPEASAARLRDLGGNEGDLTVTDDLARAPEAQVALVSTRIPRAELTGIVTRLADATCPIIGLVHGGGESLAVEIMRRGGRGVIAEGNEAGLLHLLGTVGGGDGLLDSYDRHMVRTESATAGTRGRDPVTGLPDRAALEVRLAGLEHDGEAPRLVYVRVTGTPIVPEELSDDAAVLVRRRIATQFLHVGHAMGAQVFATGTWDFAMVATALSPHAVEQLGRALASIVETYTPAGLHPLRVAVGHAGPEVSSDVAALREAAQRAVDAAAADRNHAVVSSESLALGVSGTTELEAALKLVDHVERRCGLPVGHMARVAEIAATLAAALGYDGVARARVQLAAHLHAVGMAGLSEDALGPVEQLTGEALHAHRQYPLRSAEYVAISAGPEVATAVRAHRERVDGMGFPDGLAGPDIPVAARVIAAARVLCEVLETTQHVDHDDVVEALSSRSGSELDPDIVAAALDLVDELVGSTLALAG
jgi:HD-GYP domain-containing protein (c-di-GMP phosphodiesterase class II)